MLTMFGKTLRTIRLNRSEYLKDMADKLSVTPAYLSAVEHGKRETPEKWINLLIEIYELSREESEKLIQSYTVGKKYVKVNIQNIGEEGVKVVNAFARRLESMDDESLSKVFEIIKENEERK